MDIFDQILENLELERELGTRTVEIDRALLVPPPAVPTPELGGGSRTPHPVSQPPTANRQPPTANSQLRAVAFFTGKPLSPAGAALLDKMIAAMKLARDQVFVNEAGRAKAVVLMGAGALRRHAPGVRTVRGSWFELDGVPAVTTFSPDFILLRFKDGSPEMRAAKQEVWGVLQAVMRTVAQSAN